MYAAVDSQELFQRVGFYRNDLKVLGQVTGAAAATNSLKDACFQKSPVFVGWFYTKAVLPALVNRLRRKRVLLVGGADNISSGMESGLRLGVLRILAALGLFVAHGIIVENAVDATMFRRLALRSRRLMSKIHIAYPVVEYAERDPTLINSSREQAFDAITLAWMGDERNVRRKGVDRAVMLIAGLRSIGVNATLQLAGSPGPGEQYIRDLAAELSVQDFVTFPGAISESEKWSLFTSDRIYLQLSLYEGFGVAAAEACLSGMLVIHTSVAGLAEIVSDNGLIVDASPQNLTSPEWLTDLVNRVSAWHSLDAQTLGDLRTKCSHEARMRAFQQVIG